MESLLLFNWKNVEEANLPANSIIDILAEQGKSFSEFCSAVLGLNEEQTEAFLLRLFRITREIQEKLNSSFRTSGNF